MSGSQEPELPDSEMMRMFASVWVKVEVEEPEPEQNMGIYEQTPQISQIPQIPQITVPQIADVNLFNNPPKPKKKRRHTKMLKCDMCDYTTVYKNCLEIHMTGHFNVKPYACEMCSYTTKYSTSLYRHIFIKHRDKVGDLPMQNKPLVSLKCDHCDYTTYFKWNLNSHKRKHKLEKQFKCTLCQYETAYRHNYIKHSKVHKEEASYKCDKCPFVTKYEGHIQRHLAQIHNEITEKANICEMCGFSTKERWRLKVHKQRSMRKGLIKCANCDFETLYNCQSKKHKRTHYSELYGNGRLINCSNLNNEINAMMETNQIAEENAVEQAEDHDNNTETEVKQTDSHELANHYTLDPDCVDWNSIQVLESDDKDRPFQCHMCNYTSKFKASVQRHFQRHHTGTQNRPYKCTNCDFSTKTKDQIALHNKRSQSETLVFCRFCKFSTKFKCSFVMHQKSHYTNKCTVCNYTCRHKYELTKHFATLHLGNGLKCKYCDYKAARKESILCHETIHTGVKPFKCTLCDYSSVRKSLLDNHTKRNHNMLRNDITVIDETKIQSLKIPSDANLEIKVDVREGDNVNVIH